MGQSFLKHVSSVVSGQTRSQPLSSSSAAAGQCSRHQPLEGAASVMYTTNLKDSLPRMPNAALV